MLNRSVISSLLCLSLVTPMVVSGQSSQVEQVLRGALGVMDSIKGQEQQRRQQERQQEQQRRQQERYQDAQQAGQGKQNPQQQPSYSQPQDLESQAECQAQLEQEALVRDIQQRLSELGYEPGPVDGVMGARTRDSILAFQRDMGLQADGVADTGLLAVLQEVRESPRVASPSPAPAPAPAPAPSQPSVSAAPPPPNVIRNIQQSLSVLGYAPGPADGVMGGRTRASIRAFQQDHGLPVDGEPDLELLTQLRALAPLPDATQATAAAPVEQTDTSELANTDTETKPEATFDILGIYPGMSMAEAEILIREHLGENLAIFSAPALEQTEIQAPTLQSGKLFLDLESNEIIAIYDYPEGASDEVVAVFRELPFPPSAAPPREAVEQALLDKYGEAYRLETTLLGPRNTLAWHTAPDANQACSANAAVIEQANWLSATGERVDSWQAGGDYRQWMLPSLGAITRDCGISVIARLSVEAAGEDQTQPRVSKLSLRLHNSSRVLDMAQQLAEQTQPALKL